MRSTINTVMYCSKHNDVKLDVTTESKTHYPNAYTVELILYVEPCSLCEYELYNLKYSTEKTLNLLGYKKEN